MPADNYVITSEKIKDPPVGFFSKLTYLGPGFILSASIVGSGELIATTILGAKAGYIMFWIIIVSCLVKVAIQLQFGKQAIISGETIMKSFNRLPGGRIKNTHWSVWAIFLLTLLKVVQIGGMLGGAAIVGYMLFPVIPVFVWTVLLAILVAILIFKNYYRLIEKASLVMIGFFTVLTIASVIAVLFTPYAFSFDDVKTGLQFQLPTALVFLAIGAFGITGVGSDEIISYNYWCLEKGYAANTGPREDTDAWRKRARGWINVMYLDAIAAMIIYTLVTAAFYLLGASVLHARGVVPEGTQVIETLASIYTETLGDGARSVFLTGAFFVLFSSVFATLAYWTRLFSDIFGQTGWISFFDAKQRGRSVAVLSFIFPTLWAIVFLFIKLPVIMIISGGVVGAVMLLIVVLAAIYFRRGETLIFPRHVTFDVFFVLSVISILVVAAYGIIQLTGYL